MHLFTYRDTFSITDTIVILCVSVVGPIVSEVGVCNLGVPFFGNDIVGSNSYAVCWCPHTSDFVTAKNGLLNSLFCFPSADPSHKCVESIS